MQPTSKLVQVVINGEGVHGSNGRHCQGSPPGVAKHSLGILSLPVLQDYLETNRQTPELTHSDWHTQIILTKCVFTLTGRYRE